MLSGGPQHVDEYDLSHSSSPAPIGPDSGPAVVSPSSRMFQRTPTNTKDSPLFQRTIAPGQQQHQQHRNSSSSSNATNKGSPASLPTTDFPAFRSSTPPHALLSLEERSALPARETLFEPEPQCLLQDTEVEEYVAPAMMKPSPVRKGLAVEVPLATAVAGEQPSSMFTPVEAFDAPTAAYDDHDHDAPEEEDPESHQHRESELEKRDRHTALARQDSFMEHDHEHDSPPSNEEESPPSSNYFLLPELSKKEEANRQHQQHQQQNSPPIRARGSVISTTGHSSQVSSVFQSSDHSPNGRHQVPFSSTTSTVTHTPSHSSMNGLYSANYKHVAPSSTHLVPLNHNRGSSLKQHASHTGGAGSAGGDFSASPSLSSKNGLDSTSHHRDRLHSPLLSHHRVLSSVSHLTHSSGTGGDHTNSPSQTSAILVRVKHNRATS